MKTTRPDSARTLVDRLKRGEQITSSEIQTVRDQLEHASELDDVYNLVRALALSTQPTPANVSLVTKHLGSQDDWTLQGVLYALGYWGLTGTFLDDFIRLSARSSWDAFPDASIAALSALGSYLEQTQSPQVYGFLLKTLDDSRVLDDPAVATERDWEYLKLVYGALASGVKGTRYTLLRTSTSSRQFERDVINEARLRLGLNSSHRPH